MPDLLQPSLDSEVEERLQGLEHDLEVQESLAERDNRLRQQEERVMKLIRDCDTILEKWKGILKEKMDAIRSHLKRYPELPPCQDTELWPLVEDSKVALSQCYKEVEEHTWAMCCKRRESEAKSFCDRLQKQVLGECLLPEFPMLHASLCKVWATGLKLTDEQWQRWLEILQSQKSRQASHKPTHKHRRKVVHPPSLKAVLEDTASENSAGTSQTKDTGGTTATLAGTSVLPPSTSPSAARTGGARSGGTSPEGLAATTMSVSNMTMQTFDGSAK